MAPMNGPKNGIIFVIPIIQLISSEYSHPKRVIHMKHIIPTISESIIFPFMNLPKVLFVYEAPSNISLAAFSLKNATTIFLLCAAKVSFIFRKYTHIITAANI